MSGEARKKSFHFVPPLRFSVSNSDHGNRTLMIYGGSPGVQCP
jgi:hypothetical protein